VDLAPHSTSSIDADGVGKYLERQSPCLVAVECGAYRQVAEPLERASYRTLDGGLDEGSVLVLQWPTQGFGKQCRGARGEADIALLSQALDLQTDVTGDMHGERKAG
jgi:hypothetical protein